MVPLHIHRIAHEITIIVSGSAKTAHIFGRDGRFASSEENQSPGSLIYSPPMSGHEWFNLSNTSMLGNLVFGLPVFRGNLYVEPDDPRLLEGDEPFSFDAVEELAAFLKGEEEASNHG